MKINTFKLNLIIDFVMFVVMMMVAGIGFLIKVALVPGYKRVELYGSDSELYFMGLDRHQWGGIHLWISIFLIFLLVVHIVLHWKPIKAFLSKQFKYNGAKHVFFSCFVILSLLLIVVPFIIEPEVRHFETRHLGQQKKVLAKVDNALGLNEDEIETTPVEQEMHELKERHRNEEIEVYGSMTLIEVSEKYKVSKDDLAKGLKIPTSSLNERIGRLRKQYNFTMNQVRDIVLEKGEY